MGLRSVRKPATFDRTGDATAFGRRRDATDLRAGGRHTGSDRDAGRGIQRRRAIRGSGQVAPDQHLVAEGRLGPGRRRDRPEARDRHTGIVQGGARAARVQHATARRRCRRWNGLRPGV